MRRRKMHGLAGSAEHHAGFVNMLEQRATNMFKAASILANDSRCGTALEEYADAVTAMGMAQVHRTESGVKSQHVGDVLFNFKKATERLKDRCVISSKLSAAPRRRRRR